MGTHRVTARDVATAAGVSPGTVSKALSGRGAVHPDTRDRILRLAREMKLQSPPVGLRDAGEPPRTIGLLTYEPFARRMAPVLLGALEQFAQHDIAFLVSDGRGDPFREQYFIDSLLRRGVDGLLVAGGEPGSLTRRPLPEDVPVPAVYAIATSSDPSDLSVIPDDVGAARSAAEHLLSTGRQRLTCILGPRREDAAQTKIAAVTEALAGHGLDLACDPLYGSWDEEWGRQAAVQLLVQHELDGLICANDVIARGAVSGLASIGVDVPNQVGVIGFDNWSLMVEGNRPRLSSVDLNLTEVGRVAATRLLERMDGSTAMGVDRVECQLFPRESTAVAVSRARSAI